MTTEKHPHFQKHQNAFSKQTDGWMDERKEGRRKNRCSGPAQTPGPKVVVKNLG